MNKKITRAVWLLTALAMLLSLCACGAGGKEKSPALSAEETELPIAAPTPHVHNWKNGVCAICGESCGHAWQGGVCTICGEYCSHRWIEGACEKCGAACPHAHHDPETGRCPVCGLSVDHRFVNLVCTRCGEEPGFITKLVDFPAAADSGTKRQGKLDSYHLPRFGGEIVTGARDLKSYADRDSLDFVVYTPYGYDPEKQYNVLILAPGAGHNAHFWFERANTFSVSFGRLKGTEVLDGLIAGGCIEPLIVVAVEYYLRGEPAQSAVWYEQNLRWYILPFLAEHYGTYGAVDENGVFVPAPEHFALLGASFGAMIGWQMLPDCADLFSYWGLLSGGFRDDEDMIARINAGLDGAHPIRLIYAGDGEKASGSSAYQHRVERIIEGCDGLEEGKNILFLASEKTTHSLLTWNIGLYNCLRIFFRNEYDPNAKSAETEDTETEERAENAPAEDTAEAAPAGEKEAEKSPAETPRPTAKP